MKWETASKLISEALSQTFAKDLIFEWHGGEPLLMGIPFYQRVVGLQQFLRKEEQQITNTIQTNGLLVNESWATFFKKNSFSAGVSLDGPASLHDKRRRTVDGEISLPSVLWAIRVLRQYSLDFGVLSVVTSDTLKIDPTEFLDFFNDLGIDSLNLLPQEPNFLRLGNEIVPAGRNLYLDQATDSWLADVFEEWLNNQKYHSMKIPIFDNIMRGLLGLPSHICNIGKGTCIGNLIGILPDGRAYHCDKFFHDDDYRLGDINFDSFEAMLRSSRVKLLEKQNVESIDGLACRWKDICRGGCPFMRYAFTFRHGNGSGHCCGHQLLYDRIYTVLSRYCPDRLCAPSG
jgi:uncharacterized protein